MLRYTLFFLLISNYGGSLGVPVRQESNNGTKIIIGNRLSDLSKQCKNEFVLAQIKSKTAMCNVELDYQDVPMQCLMFYDANHALCNITSISAADLETDCKAKVNGAQNVTTFCNEAANFTLPEGIVKREIILSVFHSVVACTKVCSEEDIRIDGTNFFCKYYKWALSKLDAAANLTKVLKSAFNTSDSVVSNGAHKEDVAAHVNHMVDGQLNATSDKAEIQSSQSHDPIEHPPEVSGQESASPGLLTSTQNEENSNLQIGTNVLNNNKSTQVPDTGKPEGGIIPELGPVVGGNNVVDQIDNAGAFPDLGPVDGSNVGDDEDQEDIGRNDNGGEDEDNPNIEVPLTNHQRHPETGDENQAQRDLSQSTIGFTQDDDHFFPFFLTAVIFVVVIYILYHNKNKVGKLIFGLLVEGRQTGRRRNSRGHAYRRLDTLEQAMSANTAAPPSKIIY